MDKNYKHDERVLQTAKDMDNHYLLIRDWVLKKSMEAQVFIDPLLNEKYVDYGTVRSTNYRVIGTKKQLYLLFCYKLNVEGWELRDTFHLEWDEFSESKQDWYKSLYKKNRYEPVIIKLIK
jgi:hypothetical protein